MIGIINYNLGNLTSVSNALDSLEIPNEIIDNPEKLEACSKLILPGVGAFSQGMENLQSLGFKDVILKEVLAGKPILGICLGMQLLFDKSFEFGETNGLGLVEGEVLPFKEKVQNLVVPHVGWNDVKCSEGSYLIDSEVDTFYFVHSFYCMSSEDLKSKGRTDYGIEFDSLIEKDHVFGCQFHPEKSQKSGLKLLKKFWEYSC